MTQNLSRKVYQKLRQLEPGESLRVQQIAIKIQTDALTAYEVCEQMVEEGILAKDFVEGGRTSKKGELRRFEVYRLKEEALV